MVEKGQAICARGSRRLTRVAGNESDFEGGSARNWPDSFDFRCHRPLVRYRWSGHGRILADRDCQAGRTVCVEGAVAMPGVPSADRRRRNHVQPQASCGAEAIPCADHRSGAGLSRPAEMRTMALEGFVDE